MSKPIKHVTNQATRKLSVETCPYNDAGCRGFSRSCRFCRGSNSSQHPRYEDKVDSIPISTRREVRSRTPIKPNQKYEMPGRCLPSLSPSYSIIQHHTACFVLVALPPLPSHKVHNADMHQYIKYPLGIHTCKNTMGTTAAKKVNSTVETSSLVAPYGRIASGG